MNPITLIDGYKLDHRRQYPQGTQRVYSNWTPRASRVEGQSEVVLFGLQYFLRKYLMEEMQEKFFGKSKSLGVIDAYTRRVNGYLGPNAIGSKHIADLHDLGYIPLRFHSLPEGTRVPLRVPMFTVENTIDEFFWLPNYIETLLSNIIWMPCTSATTAFRYRQMLNDYARRTGGDLGFVAWQGHDFSFRGLPGVEAAALSGAGHLLSFTGTDTIPAIELIEEYYGHGLPEGYLIGGSVAATEHSVMCAGGQLGEEETFDRLLDLYPTGIVSVVSDTWDLWAVITNTLPALRDKILARDGKLVIRPDSGDPVKILCGTTASSDPRANKGVIELLWDEFGGTINEQGYKVLDSHIGAIYGDSITYERAQEICAELMRKGFASTNVVLGIGSFTYQYVTRDTYGFAMKGTWVKVNDKGQAMFKNPITDDGTKKSARGRLAVVKVGGRLQTIEEIAENPMPGLDGDLFRNVWIDGRFRTGMELNFEQVRANLWRDVA